MNNHQFLESLSRVVTSLQNAMDELDDISDNDIPKQTSLQYLLRAEMEINNIIDELEIATILDGTRSGAV